LRPCAVAQTAARDGEHDRRSAHVQRAPLPVLAPAFEENTFMAITRRNWVALATGFAASVCSGAAFAAGRSIKVSLWDTGAMALHTDGPGPMMGMAMGKAGQ
jgi:hypothetical protein